MGERILDQVRHHLRQQLPIAVEAHIVLNRDFEVVLGVLGRRRIGIANTAHQGGEIDLGERASLRAGLDLGDAQQSGEDLQQRVGLGDRPVGRCCVFGGVGGVLSGILQPLAQATEGRAQVVGDVAGDLTQSVEQLLDAVEHSVQTGHQPVDLVVGAAHRDARREIALHDGPTGAADRVDAAHEVSAQQHATADRQQESQSAGPDEGLHDGALHVDQAAGILRHQQERAVVEPQAEAGEPVAAGVGHVVGGIAHEVDDAFDRRHARQVADHDLAGWSLQQIIDRAARAEIHAPRDLLGKTQQPAAAMDLGELERFGAQHRLHVALQRRGGDHVHRGEQRAGRDDEQPGIDQRQAERRRAQDAQRSTRAGG